MDGNGFDELTRRLATGRSRRSVLRGLVGGGAALVAAKTGVTLAAPEDKVTICHWSEDLGYYELISVSPNAVAAHDAHQHGLDNVGPNFDSIESAAIAMSPVTVSTFAHRQPAGGVVTPPMRRGRNLRRIRVRGDRAWLRRCAARRLSR